MATAAHAPTNTHLAPAPSIQQADAAVGANSGAAVGGVGNAMPMPPTFANFADER
jgi:hypothetical protein